MRVISNKMLVVFACLHKGVGGVLQAWRKIIESRDFVNFADLKSAFHSVDKVGDFYVFNVGGNKYRIVTIVRFEAKKVFVRQVLTHKEYNSWKP
jgi:mRNA interferase HigB